MKKYILNILFFMVSIALLSGCYTVVWEPDEPLPSENNYMGYYSDPYYGSYNYYYDYPWWLTLSPPAYSEEAPERSRSVETIRNSGDRSSSGSDRPVRTDPPSVSSGSGGSSTVSKPSSDGNSSSGSSRSGGGNDSSIRNNDGSRSSESGRRK